MGPVIECGPPPGLALRRATISSIVIPGFTLSCECIIVSTETTSPESTVSFGGSLGSSQPHWTVSRAAARRCCLPPLFVISFLSSLFGWRSEEHTSELQSHSDLVCRLLLEKKKRDRRLAHRLQEQHTHSLRRAPVPPAPSPP